MRREELYLAEIPDACNRVQRWLDGVDLDRWGGDEVVRYTVVHQVMLVDDAARSLSAALKERHPDVPWARIVGFRNTVVHEYFSVEWPVVWDVATYELPHLRPRVAALMQQEFPEAWQRFLEEH